MKVLHLLADWKWTGPAQPVVDLCAALREEGIDARLAAMEPPPEANNSILAEADRRGLEVLTGFRFGALPRLSDLRRLRQYLDAEEIDLVHVHGSKDHLLGAFGARQSMRRPPIVRTNERAVRFKRNPAARYLLKRLTDAYVTYSEVALEIDQKTFALDGRCWRIPPGMRLEGFNPATSDARADFGIRPDAFVIGVVARMQRHRRFQELLEGIKLAKVPGLRVMIVGRGTHMQKVAVEPAKHLGLDETVIFTGYVKDRYQNVVSSFDALLFLVPGSDGSCRAIRESMAMGKAVIGARRGMIPELIEDGGSGLVIDDTPANIARAIELLAGDRDMTRRMGLRGRQIALTRFDIRDQAREVKSVYEQVLRKARSSS